MWTHGHTDTRTHGHTDTHTDTQTKRLIERGALAKNCILNILEETPNFGRTVRTLDNTLKPKNPRSLSKIVV